MRNGCLCGLALLVIQGLVQAQPWYGYPASYGYGAYYGSNGTGWPYSPQYHPVQILPPTPPLCCAPPPAAPSRMYVRPSRVPASVATASGHTKRAAAHETASAHSGTTIVPVSYACPAQSCGPTVVGAACSCPAPCWGPTQVAGGCACSAAGPGFVNAGYAYPPDACACASVEETFAEQPKFSERAWIGASYIAAWTRAAPTPPLATLGPVPPGYPGFGPPFPAALGQPETTILIGATDFSYGFQSGGRIDAGYWLDCCHHFSVEASAFLLPTDQVVQQTVNPPGASSFLVGRPIIDVADFQQPVIVVTPPGISFLGFAQPFIGNLQVHATEQFWGAEFNAGVTAHPEQPCNFQFLVGGRYLQLSEGLRIDQTETVTPGFGPLSIDTTPVNSLLIDDNFQTLNRFVGLQVGGKYRWRCCRVYTDFWGKCAFGATEQNVNINGFTSGPSAVTGVPFTEQGGVLAVSSNIGNYTRDVFSFVPEAGITVAADITKWLTVRLGWSFLFWNNVVRPGDQIDLHVNPNLVPYAVSSFGMPGVGGAEPRFAYQSSNYWANFFSAGVEVRY